MAPFFVLYSSIFSDQHALSYSIKSYSVMDPRFTEKENGVRFKMYSGIGLQSHMYCLLVPYNSY